MWPSAPIPSQFVKDRATERAVGSQISPGTTSSGTPTITPTVTRSRRERRTARCLGRAPSARPATAVSAATLRKEVNSLPEDRHLLLLDARDERIDVVRVVQELLERRDHHG